MTVAICFNCGQFKHGGFTQCRKCGFKPETGIELCMSATFTDRFEGMSPEALQELVQHWNAQSHWIPTFEPLITHGLLEEYLKNPQLRQKFQLVKSAKQRWFKNEIDMHCIGPDGYEHSILACGKDISSALCQAAKKTGDNALFFLWTYEKGNRVGSLVTLQNWYIAFDRFKIIDRQAQNVGNYLRSINNWYDQLLDEFISTGRLKRQDVNLE